jgi:hypothetical protein
VLSVGARQGWFNDVLVPDVTTNATAVSNLGLSLAYTRNSTLSQFAATGAGAATFYRNSPGGNRLNYSGSLLWNRRLSSRTKIYVQDELVSAFSQTTPFLASGGLYFPYTQTLTNRALVGLERQFTPRDLLSGELRHDWVNFTSSTLTGGQQLNASLSYRRVLGAQQSVGLSYAHLWSDVREGVTVTDSLHATWTRNFSLRTNVAASLGASYFRSAALAGQLRATGSLTANHQREKTAFQLQYSRSIDQAWGFGRMRIADTVKVALSRPIGRRFDGRVTGGYGRSRDPGDPLFAYDVLFADAGLSFRPVPALTLAASYGIARLVLVTSPERITHAVDLSIAYAWRWR